MGWERKAPAYFYHGHKTGEHWCGFIHSQVNHVVMRSKTSTSHERGYLANGCLRYNERYAPDMRGHGRSVENDPGWCQCRCKRTNGCKHFSWWADGGCTLQDGRARVHGSTGVTVGPDTCPPSSSIPPSLDSWLRTLSVVSFSTKFSSITYGTCPLALAAWWRCSTSCANKKQCDHDFTHVCMPKRDACIFKLFQSKGTDVSGCHECGRVCDSVVEKHKFR